MWGWLCEVWRSEACVRTGCVRHARAPWLCEACVAMPLLPAPAALCAHDGLPKVWRVCRFLPALTEARFPHAATQSTSLLRTPKVQQSTDSTHL